MSVYRKSIVWYKSDYCDNCGNEFWRKTNQKFCDTCNQQIIDKVVAIMEKAGLIQEIEIIKELNS